MGEILKIHKELINKNISAKEMIEDRNFKIEKTSKALGTYITLTSEEAIRGAEKIDGIITRGEDLNVLGGIPMGIKDNISTKDIQTTCASQILKGYTPIYSGTAVKKLYNCGGIIMGKCNMDEFAMGSTNENSSFFPVKNPWNLDFVPGGSSGGSAASVASGEVVFSLGSDTGGSIRQPAGFCGVTGLKPTYGAVSRYGLVSYASSLDQIGPIARDVEDCAIVFDAIKGYDVNDSTSANIDYKKSIENIKGDIKGIKIGIPKEYFNGDIEVIETIKKALKVFEDLGATIEEMSLPNTEYALSAYYIIASAECSSNLARFDGVRYGARAKESSNIMEMMSKTRGEFFGKEVKKRIMIGTYALSSGYYDDYYLKALKARTLLKIDFDEAFKKYDVLITPIAPTLPYRLGEGINDPIKIYLGDICTVTINLVGIPGLTIPCGFKKGLPIGMQLLGKPFSENELFKIGRAYQDNTDHHLKRPILEV